jgi:signal transduction histidine kinase
MVRSKQEAVSSSLAEELLQLLARQGRRMPYPVFIAAAMFTWLATDPPGWPGPGPCLWLAAVALVLAVRMIVLGRLPDAVAMPARWRLRVALALSIANGAMHGIGILLFSSPSNFQFAIQSLLFVGLCAGSVATTAGYRPVFLGYVLPVIIPLIVLWCAGGRHPGSVAVGAVIALFAAVLVALAADSFRLFRESFEIRHQHVELNARLQAALAVAESASRAKTRFLASASHDLRQPIHTLSLFSAALALRPLDEATRDIARHIDTALENLTVQLDALLDISKLDAGVVHAEPAMLRLRPLLQRLADDFRPVAAAKGLRLVCDAPADATVFVDEVLLGRILSNLLDNAIKYSHEGQVCLGLAVQGDLAVATVADSGQGIAEEEQARIFEEFYQLENPERDRTKGLGLGLSIVQRLVALIGIRMEMVSRPGHGTSFHLFLPACAAVPDGPDRAAAPECSLAKRHVLVVDDEHAVRIGMQTLLGELGAHVSLADGMRQALDLARRSRPDLLLADYRLRGTENGLEVVRSLRALYPGLQAILISGDTSPDRLREARAAGIPMLHKPVTLAVLREAIAHSSSRE